LPLLPKITGGLASHWPCVTDSVVYPPTGSMALKGRWAPRLRSGGARPTSPYLTLPQNGDHCIFNGN